MNGFETTDFAYNSELLLNTGYSFDFISDKQITQCSTRGNNIHTIGNHYKTLVYNNTKYIRLATFQKLLALAQQGATIIFYKSEPKTCSWSF